MTAVKSLHELIAPAYLAGATKAAKARRWLDAESDLVRYAALLPGEAKNQQADVAASVDGVVL